jgi:cyclase
MLKLVSNSVNVPIIAFGGVFTWAHLVDGINAGADAVAVANQFHYTEQATRKAKSYLNEMGIPVRRDGQKLA